MRFIKLALIDGTHILHYYRDSNREYYFLIMNPQYGETYVYYILITIYL